MKKINILAVIIFFAFCFTSETANAFSFFKKDKTKTDTAEVITNKEKQNKTEDYVFPLDKVKTNNDMFDFNESSFAKPSTQTEQPAQIQEAKIEKSDKALAPDETAFSRNLQITSDTVDFYTETSQYVAKGNALLVIPEEKVELRAKEIIIDQRSYEITAIGDVKISKEGSDYYGDYVRINTKKESSFFSNPILYYPEIIVEAKSATMYTNETMAKDGIAQIKKKSSMIISSSNFGGMMADRLFQAQREFESTDNKYKIVAKKITVKRGEERTDILVEHAKLYRGKHFVGYSPVFTLAEDKDQNYAETIIPEMGNKTRIGTFIAPSVVFALPNAATLKAGPLIAMDTHGKFGLGGFARLSTPKSKSTIMYSSATDNFLFDITYNLTDNLHFSFIGNDYIQNGWMGGILPNYGVELAYDKEYTINAANMGIRNRLTAGLYQDNKDYGSDALTTMKYQWMVHAYNSKPILAWEKYLMLGYVYQHSFNLYQTGNVMGVLRAGPRIYTDLGRLFAEVTYFMGSQMGDSPFWFDRYRYGRNNVTLRAQYYINKYLSIGYYGSINLTDQDIEDNWLTENQFIAALGTEDMKLRIGFDTIRNTTVVGFDMMLGANKTLAEFDEMKVVDFDATSKSKNKKDKKKKTRL